MEERANVLFLIFYDSTGKVYFSMSVDDKPEGLEEFCFEIPEGAVVTGMDVSDPTHPKPIYVDPIPSYTLDQANEDVTDIQLALAELYEMIESMS